MQKLIFWNDFLLLFLLDNEINKKNNLYLD